MNVNTRASLSFPTGYGQSDTHAKTLSDGRPNPHRTAGSPYGTITAREIVKLVDEPQKVPKAEARWFIPSTHIEHDARNHAAQREHGAFWWLVLDVDYNDLEIGDIEDALESAAPGATWLIYATRSSKPGARRWRALLPLSAPVPGRDYTETATAFYRLLEDVSGGLLIADEKAAACGQLVYLPNRGEHYESKICRGRRLVLDDDHQIIRRRDEERRRFTAAQAEAATERSRSRPAISGDADQPVAHFNASHSVSDLLARYGYRQLGGSANWKSPLQTSRTYATRDYGEFWISLSGSDAVADIGIETKTGARFGDAFDLYVHFEHGGNFTAAVRAYAQEAGLNHQIHQEPGTPKKVSAATSDGLPRPNTPDNIDLSHDALAIDLGEKGWNQDAKYVATWGKWLFWTGTRWEIDDRRIVMTRTRDFLRERAEDLTDWAELEAEKGHDLRDWAKKEARTLKHKNTVANVESLARSNPASIARLDAFDGDLMLLGTPGGIVDLRTGTMRQARREDMVTKLTACAPAAPGTRPEKWLNILHEIFDHDADLVAFMQRVAGYALTGLTTEHKLLFLYGTGRNGKSVFLNTLTHIWGDYARRAAAETFLNSNGDKHATGIAGLQGARLVAASELPKGKTWDESVIKDLTGGDRMTARYMRQDFFDFDPQLTLMIAGNNQPSFRGVDEAIRARVVLVPFLVTIPPDRRDKHLADKLKAEGPAILRWAIEGAVEWQRRGLEVPAKVAVASEEYMDDEDTLGQFLADETVNDPAAFIITSDLHTRFIHWCDRQGLQHWTQNTLRKELKSRGFLDMRRNHGRGFLGLRCR